MNICEHFEELLVQPRFESMDSASSKRPACNKLGKKTGWSFGDAAAVCSNKTSSVRWLILLMVWFTLATQV